MADESTSTRSALTTSSSTSYGVLQSSGGSEELSWDEDTLVYVYAITEEDGTPRWMEAYAITFAPGRGWFLRTKNALGEFEVTPVREPLDIRLRNGKAAKVTVSELRRTR
jgi:hypothetical protein